ncbi:MAG: HEAT repeat domain-containing protein [Elusimicrobiota bacterium]
MAALFAAGLAFLVGHPKHEAPAPPEPQPMLQNPTPLPVILPSELEKVRRSLSDADPAVRWAAIELLYTLKDPSVLEIIEKTVGEDSDGDIRLKGVQLLRSGGTSLTLPALLKGLRDVETPVRLASLQALGDLGDPAAIPAVTDLLKDTEPEVRVEALHTLGRFQERRKKEFQVLADRLRRDYEAAVRRKREQS